MTYHFCHDPRCHRRTTAHPCHDLACCGNEVESHDTHAAPTPRRRLSDAGRRALDAWRKSVSEMPSRFGRLIYLASLRNAETRRYKQYRLELVMDPVQVDQAVRELHESMFAEWLALDLRSQRADLDVFLSTVEGHRRQILAACAAAAPHTWMIPDSAPEHERILCLTDLNTILELLYAEYGLTPAAEESASGQGLPSPITDLTS